MTWVAHVQGFAFNKIGKELDEITIFNKQGAIVESTATPSPYVSHTHT